MIYTCYDMIRDCRADRAEGWSYFVAHYVPVIRKLVVHYAPENSGDRGAIERILRGLRQPGSSLFVSLEPAPERWFVAGLRQHVLSLLDETEAGRPDLDIDLETLSLALEPLTLVERQAVWLETMRYPPAEAGAMLRMDPRTVEKIRVKAAERIRASVDAWRVSLLAENGRALGRAAASAQTPDCFPAKVFLDVLDGRTAWRGREEMERHVTACWHCIDHFSRLVEVVELLRGLAPLGEAESAALQAGLGIAPPSRSPWKRWFSRTASRS